MMCASFDSLVDVSGRNTFPAFRVSLFCSSLFWWIDGEYTGFSLWNVRVSCSRASQCTPLYPRPSFDGRVLHLDVHLPSVPRFHDGTWRAVQRFHDGTSGAVQGQNHPLLDLRPDAHQTRYSNGRRVSRCKDLGGGSHRHLTPSQLRTPPFHLSSPPGHLPQVSPRRDIRTSKKVG